MAACFLLVLTSNAQLVRVANTSLTLPSSLPVVGYTWTNAFPGLSFTNAVNIVNPPGETNRLFIVCKNGQIFVITNLAAPNKTLFLNLTNEVSSYLSNGGEEAEEGLFGLAFDPGYLTNKSFYICYTGQATNGGTGLHWILSRLQFTSGNTNQGNPASETYLICQYKRGENHNGGDIKFGPDGYLYVPTGDEGQEYDVLTNAQHITWRLYSGILRLDVDFIDPLGLPPNTNSDLPPIYAKTTNYQIPHDNPFIGAITFDGQLIDSNNVQTEFWAAGLRNPWRICFDPTTGNLFCADVGQDQYEEADIITAGGNYGWSWWEGTNSPPSGVSQSILDATPLPVNPMNPFVTYAHGYNSQTGDAIIGGVVYYGMNLPQLYGNYIFGDYVVGNVWAIPASQAVALTESNNTIIPPVALFSDNSSISTFGVDPHNGDILYAAIGTNANGIRRVIYNSTTNGTPIPPTLYDTGAFTNLPYLTNAAETLEPAPGIVPYTINVSFWSDNAIKSRWFSVPNTNCTIGFDPVNNWTFPAGMVLIKNFNLEITNGNLASQIRLETRFLVLNTNGVYGVTYIWNSLTNATLAPAAGMSTNITVYSNGVASIQTWHFPAQSECLTCHTSAGGYGLGFRTDQLNCPETYGSSTTNQIQALSDAGYFSSPVTNNPDTFMALATSTNTNSTLEFRARSFLAANCAQCHQPNGTAQQSLWDARITTPTALAGLIDGTLINNLGNTNNCVIAPMAPTNSVLLIRDAARDLGSNPAIQMPPLDSYLVDSDATNLMTEWIKSLTNTFWLATTPQTQTITAGGTTTFTVAYVATPDLTNEIHLSLSNIFPANVGLAFDTNYVNQTTTNATLTVSTSSSTTPGTYTDGIWGTGNGLTNFITFCLTILPGPQPVIDNMEVVSNNFVLSGSNGVAGAGYYVLTTTNLALPTSEWKCIATNTFDANGNFIFTNDVATNVPAVFYLIELQ